MFDVIVATDPREAYQPQDTLTLWWLADPANPQRVGTLRLVLSSQSVGFQYARSWLATGGIALSEDLPLRDDLFIPARKGEVIGFKLSAQTVDLESRCRAAGQSAGRAGSSASPDR